MRRNVLPNARRRPGFFRLADVVPLVRAAQKATEAVGAPVIGVSIVPEDCPPPSDDVRKAMGRWLVDLLGATDSLHFVMEGRGFRTSIGRSAVATILLFSSHRKRVFVHATVQAALAGIATKLTKPVPYILASASRQGILTQEVAVR